MKSTAESLGVDREGSTARTEAPASDPQSQSDWRDDHGEWSRLGLDLLRAIQGAVKSSRDAHPEVGEGYASSIVQRVHGEVMATLRRRRVQAGVHGHRLKNTSARGEGK